MHLTCSISILSLHGQAAFIAAYAIVLSFEPPGTFLQLTLAECIVLAARLCDNRLMLFGFGLGERDALIDLGDQGSRQVEQLLWGEVRKVCHGKSFLAMIGDPDARSRVCGAGMHILALGSHNPGLASSNDSILHDDVLSF
jgi:hypothetical protein